MESAAPVPAYFELSWGILSTIGLVNFLNGLMVLGIIGFAPVCLVPIVVSASGAVANGLCYVAFYTNYPPKGRAVASALADATWLIEEAGLSFYGYIILTSLLHGRRRRVFTVCFWSLMVVIAATKFAVLACRVRYILEPQNFARLVHVISRLHTGYFGGIALVECLSAGYLLSELSAAVRTSRTADRGGGVSAYLLRSTEIRLATLAFVGILRCITYNFQDTAQSATTPANQLDRFAATLEVLFPIVMYIDVLASRLVFVHGEGVGKYYDLGAMQNGARSGSVAARYNTGPTLGAKLSHEEIIEAQSASSLYNWESIISGPRAPRPALGSHPFTKDEIKSIAYG